MDALTSSPAGQVILSPEQRALSQARAQDRARQAEEAALPPVEGLSAQEIQERQAYLNRTLDTIDRLRYPENLPATKARPLAPDRAGLAAPRLGDSNEAKELRTDYDFQNRTFDMIRENAKSMAEKYGEGRHTIQPGVDITITKKNGRVSVTHEFKPVNQGAMTAPKAGASPHHQGQATPAAPQGYGGGMLGGAMGMGMMGPSSSTIEYDEKDANYVSQSSKFGTRQSGMERNGTTMKAPNFDGGTSTFVADGDKLTRIKQNDKDGTTEKMNALADGSVEIQKTSRGPDGKPLQEKKTIPRNEYKAALGDYVKSHSYSVDDQGAHQPLKDDQVEALADGLSSFDKSASKQLMDEGITFAVADPSKAPRGGYPGDVRSWLNDATGKRPSGGWYSPKEKTIVLSKNCVVPASVYHEGAHALDDFREKDVRDPLSPTGKRIRWHSDNDRELQGLYKNYKERSKSNDKVWSEYGRTNVMEYFAEGVESYLAGTYSKKSLQEKDPEMYRYVEKFLKQGS
jgi:hypothetical protein